MGPGLRAAGVRLAGDGAGGRRRVAGSTATTVTLMNDSEEANLRSVTWAADEASLRKSKEPWPKSVSASGTSASEYVSR